MRGLFEADTAVTTRGERATLHLECLGRKRTFASEALAVGKLYNVAVGCEHCRSRYQALKPLPSKGRITREAIFTLAIPQQCESFLPRFHAFKRPR